MNQRIIEAIMKELKDKSYHDGPGYSRRVIKLIDIKPILKDWLLTGQSRVERE